MKNYTKIFKPDGKSFVLAIDHPLTMPSPDLTDIQKVIETATDNGVDAFLVSYGTIKKFRDSFKRCGLIMRADCGTTRLGDNPAPLKRLFSAQQAEDLGADALMCMGFPGSTQEGSTLENLANMIKDAHMNGFYAAAEMLPFGFEKPQGKETRSVENVSFACRLGAEMGADFIKTEFVGGERFSEVVRNCYVPVLVLGGSKAKSEDEILKEVEEAMAAGASGVIMGRNIVRSNDMASLCRSISEIVHK